MELEKLKELQNLNELDLLFEIIDYSNECKKDTERAIKGQKASAVRVRQKMQDIKLIADIIREKIQEKRGIIKEEKALDKAIQHAKNQLEKDKKIFAKKAERLRAAGY